MGERTRNGRDRRTDEPTNEQTRVEWEKERPTGESDRREALGGGEGTKKDDRRKIGESDSDS